MGRACSMYREERHTGLWWGDLRGGDHLEDQAVDGKIILKWIFRKWIRGMEWIDWLRTGTDGWLF